MAIVYDNPYQGLFNILREILDELREIHRRLKPSLTLHVFPKGRIMASIVAGKSGTFEGVVTASDGSVVTSEGWGWSSSDTTVTIANDPADTTGATVIATVPASDLETTFTLTATATASSPTAPKQTVTSAPFSVTVTPSPVPVVLTLTISEKA